MDVPGLNQLHLQYLARDLAYKAEKYNKKMTLVWGVQAVFNFSMVFYNLLQDHPWSVWAGIFHVVLFCFTATKAFDRVRDWLSLREVRRSIEREHL